MRFDALTAINDAIDQDERLTKRQKRRLKMSVRFRPRVREEVTGMVMAECHADALITEDGHIEAAVDWDKIIDLIIKLLPLFLTFL